MPANKMVLIKFDMLQEKGKANQLLSCKLLPSKPANVSVEPSKFDPFKLIFLQSQAEQSLQTSKQVIPSRRDHCTYDNCKHRCRR